MQRGAQSESPERAAAAEQRREDAGASHGPPRKAVAPFSRELCLTKFAPSVSKQTVSPGDTDARSGTHAPRGSAGHLPAPPARCPAPGRAGSGRSSSGSAAPAREGRAGPRGRELLQARSQPAPSSLPARSRRRPSSPRAARPTPPLPRRGAFPLSRLSQRCERGGRAPGARCLHRRPPRSDVPRGARAVPKVQPAPREQRRRRRRGTKSGRYRHGGAAEGSGAGTETGTGTGSGRSHRSPHKRRNRAAP